AGCSRHTFHIVTSFRLRFHRAGTLTGCRTHRLLHDRYAVAVSRRHHRRTLIPHLAGTAQHLTSVRIGDGRHRRVEREPATRSYPFIRLGPRTTLCRAHQEEMAGLVDCTTTETEAPLYSLQPPHEYEATQPRFLEHLTESRLVCLLTIFQVAFGKAPVPVAVPDQQHSRGTVTVQPHDHTAGRHLLSHLLTGQTHHSAKLRI